MEFIIYITLSLVHSLRFLNLFLRTNLRKPAAHTPPLRRPGRKILTIIRGIHLRKFPGNHLLHVEYLLPEKGIRLRLAGLQEHELGPDIVRTFPVILHRPEHIRRHLEFRLVIVIVPAVAPNHGNKIFRSVRQKY